MMWWWIVLTVVIFPGCVSLAAQNATRAPQGRASTQIACSPLPSALTARLRSAGHIALRLQTIPVGLG